MWEKLKRFTVYWLVKITHGWLTCAEADKFVVDYLEYKLDPQVRRRFENHLENCVCCKEFLKAYRRTIELTRAYCEPTVGEPAPRMPPELVQAILAARKSDSS